MKAINKWNGNLYTVLNISGSTVKLQKPDGSVFEIQKSEYYFSYKEVKDGNGKGNNWSTGES